MRMDTSEIYIKQCDYGEIQKQRKLKIGDIIKINNLKPDIIISIDKDRLNEIQTSRGFGFSLPSKLNSIIWLPYQHQIQEMIYPHKDGVPYLTVELYGWLQKPRNYQPKSMEQLWLAFYMYEKHKKTWDGEKWRKQ